MNKRIIGLFIALCAVVCLHAQGTRSLKISEVVTCNTDGLIDEYGRRGAWIEITNTSWGTVNIHSCYLTINRAALNPALSVPERISLMSMVPKGDARTVLKAQERIVFYADGQTNLGTLHTNFALDAGQENFIALYDGNGVSIIDTITVPVIGENQSFARLFAENKDEADTWLILDKEDVTPGSPNRGQAEKVNKVAEWKAKDPYGIAMSIVAMGIVFGCLLFLYIFFRSFGKFMEYSGKLARVKAIRKIHESAVKVAVIAKDGKESRGIDMETYMAVIGMALHEYETDVHDVESNILTIMPEEHTEWNSKDNAMREWPK